MGLFTAMGGRKARETGLIQGYRASAMLVTMLFFPAAACDWFGAGPISPEDGSETPDGLDAIDAEQDVQDNSRAKALAQ